MIPPAPPNNQFVAFNTPELDTYNAIICSLHGAGPLYKIALQALIHIDKLAADYAPHLLRCDNTLGPKKGTGHRRISTLTQCYLYKMPDSTYIIAESNGCFIGDTIQVFATSKETAEHWAREIQKRYQKRIRKKCPRPSFSVLCFNDGKPQTTTVEITRAFAMKDEQLNLYYGDDAATWERQLIATMKTKDTGTMIFQGPPGTGKTTFIRHLADKLKRTHRFYYLPVTHERLLTSPEMVGFWVKENNRYEKLKKVIILEDAETLLERTPHGRSGAVANLLNIADGLLGELLKVQILCTVNCEITELDSAIIRPGRLIAFREFPRIPPERARHIAQKHNLGAALPDLPDYGLSDIFGKKLDLAPVAQPSRRILGFAAGFHQEAQTN
ncbi:hypothetical protein M2103_001629 [Ereboglobus sp. PH5-5]|uniref:AAA family ATPase n=1 Tax=Ereboglobus sp. PH5-5 TaxID=2940529 RepID=UPI0024054A81|nr:AAA family ATPase [Ereboglobus sp. PH5-5]MDF9833405.1 hypothetical protein [Ereboglobus sp. PH5-5]